MEMEEEEEEEGGGGDGGAGPGLVSSRHSADKPGALQLQSG